VTSPSWLQKLLGDRLTLGRTARWVMLSAVVGVLGAIAAWAFRAMIGQFKEWFFLAPMGTLDEGLGTFETRDLLILLVPTVGGLLVGWLISRFSPDSEGHGTDSVIRAFHRAKGVVHARVILFKSLTSALTIGTGGAAGQEGPVAQVGAGIGSSLATKLGLSDRDRRILLLSGASAGIGATFCSPLGGALFMPEVLYRKAEFEGEALVPCILSSIFAYATYMGLAGHHTAVEIQPHVLESFHFQPMHVFVYAALGILCTLIGWVYVKVFYGVHDIFGKRMKAVPAWIRPGIGGFLVGLMALALGPIAGGRGVLFGGYGLMEDAIAGNITIGVLAVLIFAKILATSLSVSSGGSGGVFAPALAIGALIGGLVGAGAAGIGIDGLEPGAVALVGMGGFFAGVAKAPIASVVLVSEMTGGYELLAPLMLVAVLHLLLSRGWTLYNAQVESQIDSPAHTGDFVVDVLQSVKVQDVLGEIRPPRLIHEDVTLRGAMRIVSDSHETHFPVVDDEERLVGIFSLTDLRRIFLEEIVEDFVIVQDFMREQVVTVELNDNLHDVQRVMTRKGVSAVPVVDADDPRRVLALLERNAIGRAYAERLAELKGTAS
tara:strand:+ start:496 stop:2304 length:1809 start_codon:yes stop_codon:yes gene_type:complete